MPSWTVTNHALHAPALEDLIPVITSGLEETYADVEVEVTSCPDLTKAPFSLAASGICGNERIADIGGQSNLAPTPKLDRIYSLVDMMRLMEMSPDSGLVVGASAGPFTEVGVNSELAPNLSYHNGTISNNTHCAKVVDQQQCDCYKLDTTSCGFMANLFGSDGAQGPALHIVAKQRTGTQNFISAIRSSLSSHYGSQPVSLGGVFVIRFGKAKLHVMPDFSKTPLENRDAVEKWLKFYEMRAPLTCLTVFHSSDPEDLGLRMEHTHCFSEHGEGGHYHEDTTPGDVVYEAYLNVAKTLYRIDKPTS